MPLVKTWAIFISHIWGLLSVREHPQDLFNAELFKPRPFIPELKLRVFWAPIFIKKS
jgi:hypothetical protein